MADAATRLGSLSNTARPGFFFDYFVRQDRKVIAASVACTLFTDPAIQSMPGTRDNYFECARSIVHQYGPLSGMGLVRKIVQDGDDSLE